MPASTGPRSSGLDDQACNARDRRVCAAKENAGSREGSLKLWHPPHSSKAADTARVLCSIARAKGPRPFPTVRCVWRLPQRARRPGSLVVASRTPRATARRRAGFCESAASNKGERGRRRRGCCGERVVGGARGLGASASARSRGVHAHSASAATCPARPSSSRRPARRSSSSNSSCPAACCTPNPPVRCPATCCPARAAHGGGGGERATAFLCDARPW